MRRDFQGVFWLASCWSLLAIASLANGQLVEKDLWTYGDGLLAVDEQTGMEWLDLTVTRYINPVTVENGWGGWTTTYGFRVADHFSEVWPMFHAWRYWPSRVQMGNVGHL